MAAFHWCDFCFWPPLNNWGEKACYLQSLARVMIEGLTKCKPQVQQCSVQNLNSMISSKK